MTMWQNKQQKGSLKGKQESISIKIGLEQIN
jgi:hypothetical protein